MHSVFTSTMCALALSILMLQLGTTEAFGCLNPEKAVGKCVPPSAAINPGNEKAGGGGNETLGAGAGEKGQKEEKLGNNLKIRVLSAKYVANGGLCGSTFVPHCCDTKLGKRVSSSDVSAHCEAALEGTGTTSTTPPSGEGGAGTTSTPSPANAVLTSTPQDVGKSGQNSPGLDVLGNSEKSNPVPGQSGEQNGDKGAGEKGGEKGTGEKAGEKGTAEKNGDKNPLEKLGGKTGGEQNGDKAGGGKATGSLGKRFYLGKRF